jgi:hypothetical protein
VKQRWQYIIALKVSLTIARVGHTSTTLHHPLIESTEQSSTQQTSSTPLNGAHAFLFFLESFPSLSTASFYQASD